MSSLIEANRLSRPTARVRRQPPSRSGFRPDVQGLRAVAIVLVVLYHVGFAPGGYVGVDVFFVISGFLITGQLVRELHSSDRISFLAFYARRARRILPAATVVIIATVVASALLLAALPARRVLKDALTAICFGANFHFAAEGADYFNSSLPPSPLQHFWSLSVEEQFYLCWPLLMLIAGAAWIGARDGLARIVPARLRPGQRAAVREPGRTVAIAVVLAVAAALSLTDSLDLTPESPSWAYYSILSRAWELAAGGLIALGVPLMQRVDRRAAAALSWGGAAAILVAALAFSDSTAYPGDAALLPVAGAAAVIAAGSVRSSRGSAEAVLATSPFQRLGDWSYSWYLWHWPFLLLAPAALGHALSQPQELAVAAVSLLVAAASFVVIERPVRRMAFIVHRPGLGLAGGGALALGALAAVAVSGALVGPLVPTARAVRPALARNNVLTRSQLTADLETGARTIKVPANLTPSLATAAKALPLIVENGCHLQHPGVKSQPCVYGDTKSAKTLVLFGDSHAAAWFPALQVIAEGQHWRLVDLTKAGCPPVEVDIAFAGNHPYPECARWRRNAMAEISALHPVLVIATWARFIEHPEARPLPGVPRRYGNTWQDGVAAIFSFLRRAAQHTVFISDGPTLAQLAPDCVSGHLADVRPCLTPRSKAIRLPRIKQQELALARANHIPAIDPTSWFCAATRCPVIVGNILLYRDNAHMVPAWSRFIAPVLEKAIMPVVTAKTSGRPTR